MNTVNDSSNYTNFIESIMEQTGGLMQFAPYLFSLLGGLLLFFSPCTLPLYPAYLAYLTGMPVASLQKKGKKWGVSRALILHSLCFVAGISPVFYALGLGASTAGSWFSTFWNEQKDIIRIVGGTILIFMGLIMAEVLQPAWLFRMQRHVDIANQPIGYTSSILIGLGSSAAWLPCNLPILSLLFTLVAQEPDHALGYITLFCLGFGIPFMAGAFLLGLLKSLVIYTKIIKTTGGIIMILLGFLLISNKMNIFQ